MKISTDKQKIEELLTRGVENIYPKPEFLDARLKEGKQLKLYTGYDPTAPTLHIGHGITMLKLRQFQDLGHKVIMLIGDFTGKIGDPTDKTSARVQLTDGQIKENLKEYKKQASSILNFKGKNKVEVKYNSKWLSKMNLDDFMGLAEHFTVPRLLERDMFQKRLKEGKTIHLHEFLYPVMQAYDSVAMNVDGEVGGNDQTFNMLAGRELMKDVSKKEKFVLTGKLLTDSSGKKMGKTEGNMIALSDSPEDMFGKVMSWTDGMIVNGFELCTIIPMVEVKEIEKSLESGGNPRDYKLKLAYEVVKTFLSEDGAKKGQANFEKVIQSKDKPEEIKELTPSKFDIITVLVEAGFVKSTTEARQNIKGGGVKVNDKKIEDHAVEVKTGDIVQKGKRFFVKIK